MSRRGLSLIEVLLASVLLGAVVVACLPLLRPAEEADALSASVTLDMLAGADRLRAPSVRVRQFEGRVGASVDGRWRVVETDAAFGVAWVAEDRDDGGSP